MKIKNIILLSILALSSILIFSCTKNDRLISPENPAEEFATTIEDVPGASTYHSQETWLMDETRWVPCANNGNGEFVHVNGYVHYTYKTVVNDNHFTLVTHTNLNEVSGIGLTTGDKYVASGGGQALYSGSIINGQTVATGTTKFMFTGAGPGNNLTIVFKANFIVNANGDVKNESLEVSTTCK